MNGKNTRIIFGIMISLSFMSLFGILPLVGANDSSSAIKPASIPGDWVEVEADVPTGTRYLLPEHHGGFWADAEKAPGDDGPGNPAPDNPGDEDDLLCWAATASNMMEWTGWGFIGGMEHGNTDTFFDFFIDHVTDHGHFVDDAIDWWFDGTLRAQAGCATEDVDHAGFWLALNPWDYIFDSWNEPMVMLNIDTQLSAGHPVGLTIYQIGGPGAHAITCWGFNYNETTGDYLGIWVTDSDNSKGSNNPDDRLTYFEVEWDSTNNYWFMPGYHGGWRINAVTSLEMVPGLQRPVASVSDTVGTEGVAITFDASATTDPDSATLEYRWDFDADGVWDTLWSTSPTATHTWNDDYTGTVYLEVFDGRLRDIDTATVTVNNAAPVLTVLGDVIDENGVATVSGAISDTGSEDTFVLTINWGEGATETFNFGPGPTLFSLTHQYLDDNPTGTLSDTYMISLSVIDDDGGSDATTTTVIVNNVNPLPSIEGLVQDGEFELDENFVVMLDPVTFTATATDIGTDDLMFIWNWGDGTPETTTTYLYGGSPVLVTDVQEHVFTGSGEYLVTLTVVDDDTGTSQESITITVLGPRDLKLMAIEDLESLKTGKRCEDAKIECTIRKIEHSLWDNLWMDEVRLKPHFGTSVFCNEMAAVNRMEVSIAYNNHLIWKYERKIAYLESKGYNATVYYDKIAELQDENLFYESIILKLVKADELIARVALNDAMSTPVENSKFQGIVDYKLSKAEEYLLLGMESADNGDYSESILCYKLSWKYSQCAIKFAQKHC